MIATAHTYAGMKTINGVAGDLKVPAKPGQQVRVRVTNTDNGPIETGPTRPSECWQSTATRSTHRPM